MLNIEEGDMRLNIAYSVVVPIYNSGPIVEELVRRIAAVMEELECSYEIILADDCSTDDVWQRILKMAAANSKVKGCRLSNNFGQWMATLAGISHAKGESIITIDDDLEYDPADIKKLIEKFNSSGCYVVFGLAPQKYKGKGKSDFFSGIRNMAINTIWQKYVTDSFKIFKRELLFKNGNEFSPAIHFEAFISHILNKRFVDYCEVGYHPRFQGSSNYSLFKKLDMLLKYSMEYYRYPAKGLSVLFLFVLLPVIVLEYVFFSIPSLHGWLFAVISVMQIFILLLLLQYAANIYLSVKKIPEYWIIERTPEV